MKKRTSKAIVLGLILMLTVSAMAFLTSCGGPSTLEEYINDNKAEQEKVEKIKDVISLQRMDRNVEVKDNEIILTVTLDQAFNDKQLEQIKPVYDRVMDAYESEAQKAIKEFEEDSKIEGITITFTVLDKNKKEISTKYFTAAK